MIFDIIIAVIVLLFVVIGYKKGFAATVLHTLDWILGLVAAYIWSAPLGEKLKEGTNLYDHIYETIAKKSGGTISELTSDFDSLPSVISGAVSEAGTKVANTLAANITDAVFSILCFAIIVFGVKILLHLIICFFEKKHDDDSLIGKTDQTMGLICGLVKGVLVVFILLAAAVPCISLFSPEKIEAFHNTMESSYFAHILYDNNLLLTMIKTILSGGLNG